MHHPLVGWSPLTALIPGLLVALLIAISLPAVACASDSADDVGTASDDVSDDGCPTSSTDVSEGGSAGDDSDTAAMTSMLQSALGSLGGGAASAAGGDLFGWLLSAAGIGGSDNEAMIAEIETELQEVNQALDDICNELADIDGQLQENECADDAGWGPQAAADIRTWYDTYQNWASGMKDQDPIISPTTDTKSWADDVLDTDSGAFNALEDLQVLALESTSGGTINDCIKAATTSAGAPELGTLDDRPCYEAVVVPIQNWYYAYLTMGFWVIYEAYHLQAWEAAGEPTGSVTSVLADVCSTGTTTTTTESAAGAPSATPAAYAVNAGTADTTTSSTAPTTTTDSTAASTTTTTGSTTTTAPTTTTTTSNADESYDCGEPGVIYQNNILQWLEQDIAAGGAPYSTDDYVMANGWVSGSSAGDFVIVTSIEDYSTAAGGDCSSPLTSTDLCGPLVGEPSFTIPAVGYGAYGGDSAGTWVSASSAARFNQMLRGYHDLSDSDLSATAAGWLCKGEASGDTTSCTGVATTYGPTITAVGLENADKIIVFDDKTTTDYGVANEGSLGVWCFFDGAVPRNRAAQPLCESSMGAADWGNLMESHRPDSVGSRCGGLGSSTVIMWFDDADWTRTGGTISDAGFYQGVSCLMGDGLFWNTGEEPDYSTDLEPKSYRWPILKWIDLKCTGALDSSLHGQSAENAVNPAGIPTMCGVDYAGWLQAIVSHPL